MNWTTRIAAAAGVKVARWAALLAALRARPEQKSHRVHTSGQQEDALHDEPERFVDHHPHSAAMRYHAVPSRAMAHEPEAGTAANKLTTATVAVVSRSVTVFVASFDHAPLNEPILNVFRCPC
jgi:hypothetical protein